MKQLYDYYSIYYDEQYGSSISEREFNQFFENDGRFTKQSKFKYYFEIEKHKIGIQGIQCDNKGNYAFNSDNEFVTVNLIEVNIPQGAERYHDELVKLGIEISKHFKWVVNWEN